MMSTMWTSKSFHKDDVDLCLQQLACAVISDTVAIGNDGILKDPFGFLSRYGWTPRFLQHYVRNQGVLCMAESLRRITSLPAARFGLPKRGVLKRDHFADICVFDPESIANKATARHPCRYATGVAYVLVNGRLAMRHGKRTSVNAGQVLRDFLC